LIGFILSQSDTKISNLEYYGNVNSFSYLYRLVLPKFDFTMRYFRMKRIKKLLAAFTLLISIALQAQLQTPEEFFGFSPGAEKMLFNYEQMMEYLKVLDENSDRIRIEEVGKSSFGKPMYIVSVSSEANIAKLDRLKMINEMLALDANLDAGHRQQLINEGRVFVYMTLSMHSSEVGPSQAAPVIAYELATAADDETLEMLEEVVYMMIPSHNPDGMNMIAEHYNKTKNTPLDGSSMPGVYHKYVGHNINRDFVWLTQPENKVVARLYTSEWFPQVMIEKHQMGSTGPRYFVSPPHDPIAENVDAGIWNWQRIFGSAALTDMTAGGLKGISVNYLFDDYWPGSTTTSIWKGVIGMLSEAAGVHLASPIYVEYNELRTWGKGLGHYAKSINMPDPWPGGWWKLSDIVEYEKTNTLSYLHTAAKHRKALLEFRNDHTKQEVEKGLNEPPFYYLMPLEQHDQSELVALVNLLNEHNVSTYSLTEDILIENRLWKSGDIVVPLAQPYRSFIKEIMEVQVFPERFYTPGGEMIRPYDVTSWSLPLHKGVEATEINLQVAGIEGKMQPSPTPFRLHNSPETTYAYMLFNVNNNESFKAAFHALASGTQIQRTVSDFNHNGNNVPAGSFLIKRNTGNDELLKELSVSPLFLNENDTLPEVAGLKIPRIAIVESWFHAMDAGWLRFIFDQYAIPYIILRPADLQTADIKKIDLIIFTDESKTTLMSGKRGQEGNLSLVNYPPEYSQGMEKKGFENVLKFINKGGKVLAWGGSTDLFTGILSIGEEDKKEEFQLPFTNIGDDLAKKKFSIPGALIKMQLTQRHPLTYGMASSVGIFHNGRQVFRTSIPNRDMDRRVIGSFPEREILISGYAANEELLARQVGMVWIKKGNGQLVLYSFSPHARGQMQATYKLLFNGLFLEDL
jgi:hypothetical protein